ncbi:MAG: hypothetical protein ACR2MQ_01895 [Gemmatimonadaceae bacterium]
MPVRQVGATLAIGLGMLVPCATLLAQQSNAEDVLQTMATGHQCTDTISASSMTRVVVYVSPKLADSAQSAFTASADNFTQLVIDRARLLLGAKSDTLPMGEPMVTWRGLGGVSLTAHRDGRIDVQPPSHPPGSAGFNLLSRAIRGVHDDGDTVSWPDSVAADSFSFSIDFISPSVDRAGKVSMGHVRIAVPLFSVAAPWEEDAMVVREGRKSYPSVNQRERVTGNTEMQFVVDTTGRADMSTVRDVWPAATPQLTGAMHEYYIAFVQAARATIESTRYQPARIGGCAVRMLVHQPYFFGLR